MEGLLLAKFVTRVQDFLPFSFKWSFPDEASVALCGVSNLVFSYRLPEPTAFISKDVILGEPITPFQRALAARVHGKLVNLYQFKLDRVIFLEFSRSEGFIETQPLRLVFELTGRNANLILIDPENNKIIAAAREITFKQNRFRQIRAGLIYKMPPPYDKLDPRTDDLDIKGLSLAQWPKKIDGISLSTSVIIADQVGLSINKPLYDNDLDQALQKLKEIIDQPEIIQTKISGIKERKLDQLRSNLKFIWEKRLSKLENQLSDVYKAEENAKEADILRQKADILLSFAHQVPAKTEYITLPDFYNDGDIEIKLDKNLDAVANANALYAKSKHRIDILRRIEQRKPKLMTEKAEIENLLANLETLTQDELQSFLQKEEKKEVTFAQNYRTNHGFAVFVGRNAKENDFLTNRLAKSHDLWFHVQGYPGSHVILQSEKREIPFSDVLEAAQIAAYHSKVRGSQNVAVDYTFIRFVKRIKGSKNGQVHFSSQKTVFVNADKPNVNSN